MTGKPRARFEARTRRAIIRWGTAVTLATLLLGCATRFSPEVVRREIADQRGVDPRTSFELTLGRFTTYLIKTALKTPEGDTPFEGLRKFELSVYDTPEAEAAAIDVTLFKVRGWEPVIRAHDERRSLMILVRSLGESEEGAIGDLVTVGAGRRKVVYLRLQGTLSAELPAKLGEIFRRGGPDEIVDTLSSLTGAGTGE